MRWDPQLRVSWDQRPFSHQVGSTPNGRVCFQAPLPSPWPVLDWNLPAELPSGSMHVCMHTGQGPATLFLLILLHQYAGSPAHFAWSHPGSTSPGLIRHLEA